MRKKKISLSGLLLAALAALLLALPAFAQQAEPEETDIWLPDELTTELRVKAAYNGQDILWLFEWAAEDGSLFHDMLVYEDGKWLRRGDGGGGADEYGLREDRVIMLVDAGTVPGFANQGCYTACHDGLDSLSNGLDEEAVKAGLGDSWSNSDIRKYIPSSRQGENWWDGAWDALKSEDDLAALAEAGVFLDMWHWRSARGNPIGYSDDQYVLEYRSNDGGRTAFSTNWNGDLSQPNVMFDPAQVGFNALNWDKLMAGDYTQDDIYFISSDNSVPFDPDHAWQNGDVIPRRLLRMPDGSQADITADGRLVDGVWRVELRRAMDTGNHTTDHAMTEGRIYNVGFALHKGATGARWHYISQTVKVGIGTPAEITAVRFNGNAPDWNNIPWTTLTIFYPGEITWEWLTSDAHPGAGEIRADERSCQSCHGSDEAAIIKLAQASVYHETRDGRSDLNWWLTLAAGMILLVGGTVVAVNLSTGKEN
jgi:hypothetical protein